VSIDASDFPELTEIAFRLVLLFIPGVLFLLIGRRLFWLLGGFVIGLFALGILSVFLQPEVVEMGFTETGFRFVFEDVPNLPSILVGGVVAFFVGVFLTLRFPRAACGLVGLVGGAVFVFGIFELFAVNYPEPVRRTLILLGGVALAFVGLRNQNQTMILLTTIVGAGIILQGLQLNWNEPIVAIVWLLLMLTGIIFQTNSLRIQQLRAAAARKDTAALVSQN
jgi:hypothetical protein